MKINYHYIIKEFAYFLENRDDEIQHFDNYIIQAKTIFEKYVNFKVVSFSMWKGIDKYNNFKLTKDGNYIDIKAKDTKLILQLLKQSTLNNNWTIAEIIYEIEESLLRHLFPFDYTYFLFKTYTDGYFMSPAIHIHEKKVLEHSKYFKVSHHIPCNYKEYKLVSGQAFTIGFEDIDIYVLSNKGH